MAAALMPTLQVNQMPALIHADGVSHAISVRVFFKAVLSFGALEQSRSSHTAACVLWLCATAEASFTQTTNELITSPV